MIYIDISLNKRLVQNPRVIKGTPVDFRKNPYSQTFVSKSWNPIEILVTQCLKSSCNHTNLINQSTSWWFQPIWKILVKLDHFPK